MIAVFGLMAFFGAIGFVGYIIRGVFFNTEHNPSRSDLSQHNLNGGTR